MFAPDHWNTELAKAEAEWARTPQWRWLKRGTLLEQIRLLRLFAIAENRARVAELKRKINNANKGDHHA